MKQKTNRLHFSTRTIAMILSVIMLIGSIATGSMLSTFAAYLKDNVNSDAVSQAANEGGNIALNAIPSQDADAAAQADNEDKPDLSGFEENEIVRGMKDDLADTAAAADLASVGYSNSGYVKGNWGDSWAKHDITSGFTIHLEADHTYEFCFVAKDNEDVFKKDVTISGSVTKYDFPKDGSANAKLHTTVAGDYTFKFNSWDGGDTSMRVDITFPEDTTPDTWTVVGSATGSDTGGQTDALFGYSWDPTLTANDMTQSGSTWTWTKNNVELSAGTIKYKVAKNHAWDTTAPASENASCTVNTAGLYNVTVTYSGSGNPTMTLTPVTKSTLTVASVNNAVVTATYNGTTAQEGESISNIPQGATVNVSVTPDTGYQCTDITSSGGGTITGSMYSFTLTMPAQNTEVTANITTVTLKKIYFNNSYTLYGSVYAYVYDKSDGKETYQYLGKYPGTTMNKLDNSNIWYIDVPSDVDYVKFVSGEGYTTGEMEIPWKNGATGYDYPKYTAPYGHNDAPNTTNGGTWGNYIYGSDNKRTNEYTVSDGTTMSASNLFTGLTATMYDYYTDGEITNNAGTATDTTTSSGWIGGIASDEYSKGTTGIGWKWNPYTTLNYALSAYANNSSQPKYNVTTPLYFGNLNTQDMSDSHKAVVEAYHNWNLNANNSSDLDPNSTAITGLSGKTLANDTIHYYSAADSTNQNGAPMAMFDEDFLSGENNQNKALATILRTSSFPVRKTVEENVSSITKLHLDPTGGSWTDANAVFDAYFWGSNLSGTWKQFSGSGTDYVADIPSGAENVIITRNGSHVTSFSAWNQSEDISLTLSGSSAVNKVKFTGWTGGNPDEGKFSTSLDTSLSGCTTTGSHDYYEFDSTDGKDNAYITNIVKTDKTANIDYYANDAVWSGGTGNNTKGFFPFDYANKGNVAHDLGFGMKLTIPFTLNGNGTNNGVNTDGTDQEFRFSGDDDLWVFVDGKLVLDLGGAHAKTTGSINFHTKTVSADHQQAIASGVARNGSFADGFNTNENYVHTMTIYYMERGMFESNLKFGFSFHAIPNQFWIDKKIRTKDIINAGFYTSNGEEAGTAASNQDVDMTAREGRFISKFEASYQKESFTVEHKVKGGSSQSAYSTSAFEALKTGTRYTVDNDVNEHYTGTGTDDLGAGKYPIYHDLGNAFIGQFTTGDYFSLKESYGNNKYVYTPVFSVWDQANNNQAITATGDNTDGYTFHFNPTTSVTTGIENTNIKARFENYMVAHTLTLKKEITNATDTTTPFTIQVLFDFEGNGNYIAYPLHCDVDGVRTQLDGEGKIAIKAGQILEIEEIPQNAKIQVKEVLADTVSGYRYDGFDLTQGGTPMSSSDYTAVTKGVQFTMNDKDIIVNLKNKKPDNRYTIKYNYQSYDNLYGQQSYTVSGVFTENELKTYLTLDGSGNLAFKTESLKKGFINRKAPLEDNFMQTLSFADSDIDETNGGWNDGNYSCEVTATASSDDMVSVSFNLPYTVNNKLVAQESDGKVSKITAQSVGAKEVTCFDWYVTEGASKKTANWEPQNTTFVKAPLIIYYGNTPYYFQYWSVKKASSYGMKAAEYTRCYDYEFNLSLFMDTVIEPVYKTTWAQTDNPPTTYDMYNRFDPEKQIAADNTNGISIAFLENSRNQYNLNGGGSRDKGAAADVIYSDFLLSFNNFAGKEQLNTRTEGTTKAGLVIEAVGYLTGSNADGFDTTTEYRNATNIAAEATKKANIKSWVESGATNANRLEGMAVSQFDVKSLDNKNRIQYYYALNNRKLDTTTGNLLDTMQNRYKVFRAYAYIGNVKSGGGLQDVVVSDPVYFTIYDMASNGLSNNARVN